MLRLIYIMDPQCMWCYAFGKNILKLYEHYKDQLDFDVLSGGLNIHPDIPEAGLQLEQEKRPLAARIAKVTNVQFSYAFMKNVIGKTGSNLDSEPPSRILQAVKQMKRELILPFMEELLEIQYQGGKNLNEIENCYPLLDRFEIGKEVFLQLWDSEDIKRKTQEEFEYARKLSTNFPALFAINGESIEKIAGGYASLEKMIAKIDETNAT